MLDPARHPSARELAAFNAGGLSDERAAQIAGHLGKCEDCRRAIDRQPPDTFAERLKAAAPRGQTIRPGEPPRATPPPKPVIEGVPPELSSSGKYEVQGKLGEGGMGAVWKAKHAFLDCLVAIKVLKPGVADQEMSERFQQEMRASGKLRHARIVRALDAERVGDLLLLVMEYVEGVTLERLVAKKGPVPIHLACRWVAEAAEGLQHAHEQGLVHRDVKPANLMLMAATKEVKILDFGLARLPRDQGGGGQTRHQTFMGTPEYVAPEQATDARTADIRADIYSLGCTLYYLLAGRPPFRAANVMETLVAHIHDEPPPVSQWRPEVPAELAAVVAKMLAKSPKERYQTPAEVREALLAIAAGVKKGEAKASPSMPPPLLGLMQALQVTPQPLLARPRRRKAKTTRWLVRVAIALGIVLMAVAAWIVLSVLPGEQWRASANKEANAPPVVVNPDGKNEGDNGGKEAKKPPAEVKLPEAGPPAITNSIGMKLVRIPAGKFLMGSPGGEQGRSVDEGPQHEVEITQSFHLGVHEVTQEQYERVMGKNPSYFSAMGRGKDKVAGVETRQFPVEYVSWEEAVEFCAKLTEQDRKERKIGREQKYRLPTEAEWEYACRGGVPFSTPFHFGNSLSSAQTNFDGNHPYGGAAKGDYLKRTCKVGLYEPNAFGLYDMHGNVWEWCQDWYDKDYYKGSPKRDPAGPSRGLARVIRGGCWSDRAERCRAAHRHGDPPGDRYGHLGFRPALVSSGEERPPAAAKAKPSPREITNSIGMKLVRIPAGKFTMGSPDGEVGRTDDEGPQHEVEITTAFYLGVYEVTQEEYEKVMGTNPSYFSASGAGKEKVRGMDTRRFPVEMVSWDNAVEFCRKLSERREEMKSGRPYRLPREAEWEYACRGEVTSSTPFHFGKSLSSMQANFVGDHPYGGGVKGPYMERTCRVGSYEPNVFGLYDMHGSVCEWCSDWHDKDYYRNTRLRDPDGPASGSGRNVRGGGWNDLGHPCRSAARRRIMPTSRYPGVGFRVVLVPSGE